ncbi:hypothetical protein [Microvirga massiliensis]|uniref:hypothetical protein n=1 Tax=Microvirga massiliensis TaxID=1033741 RepID=UPI000AF685AF|nr:hypothetical protein [Microvirga massiliensis]
MTEPGPRSGRLDPEGVWSATTALEAALLMLDNDPTLKARLPLQAIAWFILDQVSRGQRDPSRLCAEAIEHVRRSLDGIN